jgi:hypothetical protein
MHIKATVLGFQLLLFTITGGQYANKFRKSQIRKSNLRTHELFIFADLPQADLRFAEPIFLRT